MRHLLLIGQFAACLLEATAGRAQAPHRHVLPPTGLLAGQAVSRVFYQLEPAAPVARGLLVLLPGRGEPARHVFQATSLPQEAARRGLVVVVPDLHDRIYLDAASRLLLDAVVATVARQRPALARQLLLGGFSAGGQLAVAYAERLVQDSAHHSLRVRAVLGVDPPLDLAEHWQRAQYHLDRQNCPAARAGDERTLQELTRDLGGSPAQVPARYLSQSAFLRTDSAGGQARWLRALPVRVYCEPDLTFWQQHYCSTLRTSDLNADMDAAFIARLHRLGNTRAVYKQTSGKGFAGRQRMPHSWSIVDAPECAEWLRQCLE